MKGAKILANEKMHARIAVRFLTIKTIDRDKQ
jgi:hypothetical protein